jgi:hypothetical protein
VTFARATIPASFGGAMVAVWSDGDAVIVIDPTLGRRARNEALAHELVHIERGCAADAPPGLAAKEEIAVRGEVVRRLLPTEDVGLYVARRVASDLPVTAWDVAEEFDCSEQLAERALLGLKGAGS